MPLIKVWGLPAEQPEEDLRLIDACIKEAVIAVRALELTSTDVLVIFPSDMLSRGRGEIVIVEIFGLTQSPERTAEVRAELARLVGTALHRLQPDCNIECFVHSFNLVQGFWVNPGSSGRKET